jgi:SAM-dependent methyltransferase
MSSPRELFDRRLLALRRQRAACAWAQGRAGGADFLIEHVCGDLIARLDLIRRTFADVAVIGEFDGRLERQLRSRPGVRTVTVYEDVPACAAACRHAVLIDDLEHLELPAGSLDLIVSALCLQHVGDLPGMLARLGRALRPDGLFLAALVGGETLEELRQSLVIAESEIRGGASPRVTPFAAVATLGGLLQRAGLALPVADTDRLTATYADALALMRDLRAMGATNVLAGASRQPLSRTAIARTAAVYADRFPAGAGRIRATFDIVTLTAWAPHASQQKPLRPGSATVRLADVLQRREGDEAGDGEPDKR